MKKYNEEILLEKKELREEVVGRTEVLDVVGELLLLSNTECATTDQVANYYKVRSDVIRQVKNRNNDELESDGVKHYSNRQLKEMTNRDKMSQLKFPPKWNAAIP